MHNTLMLYLLTFSNYFLSLMITPYETRVLGAECYGLLGTATAVMVYFQLFVDFGFLLSATQEVALHRNNTTYLCKIFSTVTGCKLILAGISAVLLVLMCRLVPAWNGRLTFYLIYFSAIAANSMIPDYLYRGLERMSAITLRTVCIKVFFTAGIVLFVKNPTDVWKVPLITAIGNLIAMIVSYWDLQKRFNIHFCSISLTEVLSTMKQSSVFFYSRIATTAYSALNTIILDMICATGAATAMYTSADKLISTGKSALAPISDSLYPYMAANKDFHLVKKTLLVIEPAIILFCGICFVWAEPLCGMLFGKEFIPAGQVLRAMLPVGIVILPSYLCGFPMMSAMGISEYANYSTIFGAACQMIQLLLLFLSGQISMITLGLSVSVTESLILLYRLFVIYRNRRLLYQGGIK